MRPATLEEYNKFLEGYLRKGGTYTHKYLDRNYGQLRGAYSNSIVNPVQIVEEEHAVHIPEHGSASRIIIVPEGVKYEIDKVGHDTILFMSNYKIIPEFSPFLPRFKDSLKPEDAFLKFDANKNKTNRKDKPNWAKLIQFLIRLILFPVRYLFAFLYAFLMNFIYATIHSITWLIHGGVDVSYGSDRGESILELLEENKRLQMEIKKFLDKK